VDTIFEIGGQDAKYISLEGRHARDFDMNKVCAAGTGSFLHELAAKLGVDIVGEFERTALAARRPVQLAERCTVFMESDLVSALQPGRRATTLIAGLAYAVVRTYLNRVFGRRPVGRRVMFLGGPSLNRAVVARSSGCSGGGHCAVHREVIKSGRALAVRDAARAGSAGPRGSALATAAHSRSGSAVTPPNECKLRVYDFGGRASIWGGECGRYEVGRRSGPRRPDLFAERAKLFQEALEGRAEIADTRAEAPGRPPAGTIGVPLALHGLGWGVFWTHLLAGLGWQVVITPPTDERIVRAGIASMTAETASRQGLPRARRHLPSTRNAFPAGRADAAGAAVNADCSALRRARSTWSGRPGIPERASADAAPAEAGGGPPRAAARFAGAPPSPAHVALVRAAWGGRTFSLCLERRGENAARHPDEPVWVVSGRPYNLFDAR
jgi:hypothetical protein